MQNTAFGQINTHTAFRTLMDDSQNDHLLFVMNVFSANGTSYLLRDQMLICGGKNIDFSAVMTFRNFPFLDPCL